MSILDVQGYKSHLFPAAGFEGFSILNPHGTRVQGLPIYRVPQPRPFIVELFLDFCAVFSPELPINFLVIMIHQLIWPSAGPPVPSRDSLFETTRETVTDSCHIHAKTRRIKCDFEILLESYYLFLQDSKKNPTYHHALDADTPTAQSPAISRFRVLLANRADQKMSCTFSKKVAPHFFGQHDSPSNLVEFR